MNMMTTLYFFYPNYERDQLISDYKKQTWIEIKNLQFQNIKMNIDTTQNLRKIIKGSGRVVKGATMAIISEQSWYW